MGELKRFQKDTFFREMFSSIFPPPLKTSGSNKETFAEVALKAAMDFARTRWGIWWVYSNGCHQPCTWIGTSDLPANSLMLQPLKPKSQMRFACYSSHPLPPTKDAKYFHFFFFCFALYFKFEFENHESIVLFQNYFFYGGVFIKKKICQWPTFEFV